MSMVKSISVGNGDMFYIRHGVDSFTIIDCCMGDFTRKQIIAELKQQSSGKNVVRFISTHPDDDHIKGLAYLHEQMNLRNFYCVKNSATKPEPTDDFEQYCLLRDDAKKAFYLSKGCSRKWLNEPDGERGSAGITILWPDTDDPHYKEALITAKAGEKPNNISAFVRYYLNDGVTILWMGDIETDFMNKLETIPVGRADIVFAPHHGRNTGKIPEEWLKAISPKLIIIGEAPSEHLNYYDGYNTITQNSAGDITFECETGKTHIYASKPEYVVDFLTYDEAACYKHDFYLGTLKT